LNIASELTCIGRGLAAAKSIDDRPNTLFHVLRSGHRLWDPFEAEGTVFGSINRSQLTSLQIPRVDASKAAALEEVLSAVESRVSRSLRENTVLGATRAQLLPLLMSGKVRVRDAERVVEGVG